MCGIVGYIGDRNAAPILLNGLKKLEYRGYDSSGIAILESSNLKVVKSKGRLAVLADKADEMKISGNIGIGHTRWATHGEPNDMNSHPHISHSGSIAVVHNGIIENYLKLKDFLQTKGYEFISETDTEVIAHLIEYHNNGDLKDAVQSTINELEGSYALGVISRDCPQSFIVARKDSPLIVAAGNGENFAASDIPAVLQYTRDVYILEDNEIAVLTKDNIQIYNRFGDIVKKETFHVDWDIETAEKSGFEHFMIKEISEEPKVIKDTIFPKIKSGRIDLQELHLVEKELEAMEKIYIVACGTAYHAGVVGKYIIEKMTGIPVEVDIASEFRYREPLINEKCMAIIISQSGETLDTLMALREAKKRGAKIFSIVNVIGSSIARESDSVFYTCAGPEIAVASTKAYSAQLSALYLVAIDIASHKNRISDDMYKHLITELKKLPEVLESILSDKAVIQRFAAEHYNAKSIFFIGRGLDYALSMEGSLKLKETSYIHSEAYAGGELKHGTIALIEKGTLVVCSMTQSSLYDKMMSNIREVKARGAVVLAVTQEQYSSKIDRLADAVIKIPDVDPLFAPIAAVMPMQLFAYYMAAVKGCDVDKPRNLAKSVTVE